MGMKSKFQDFLAPQDDEEILEVDEDATVSDYEEAKSKVVNHLPQNTNMVLFEPRSFDEAEEVAKRLKENKAVVVNLHKLQRDYAQRTIDFLSGVVFALDGSIQRIAHPVILCTPKCVDVHGEIKLDPEAEE